MTGPVAGGSTEVVVVGAGPAGVAVALGLARAGRAVVVVERTTFPRDKSCGEGLLPPGVAALRRLGLLEDVIAAGARPLAGVRYVHPAVPAAVFARFPTPPGGGEPLGLGVRRLTFDAVLAGHLRAQPGVTLLENTRALAVMRGRDDRIEGVTTTAGPITAAVTVAADGLHSPTRRAAGWPVRTSGRGRYGIAGHWRMDTTAIPGITVTFADGVEWYQAPVGDGELLASALGGRTAIGAVARDYPGAARSALPHLHGIERTAPPRGAGLFLQRPAQVAGGGLFLVGDAAGYHDPATAEGIGLALLGGETLGALLGGLLRGEASPAATEVAYERHHAALWRDRRRLTRLAVGLAAHPTLTRRAVRGVADRPEALMRLLGISCGYWGFGRLSPRDWLALAGFSSTYLSR